MSRKKGRVYLVGAGPGDWELITLKGIKAIRQADVILYDFLASPHLLSFAKEGAEVLCVGKADGLHLLEQGAINKLLLERACAGLDVVRLKGGDPLVFSRGIEEALYLKRRGIDVTIIQGITSAFAAPESFGIPLTRKGRQSSVAVLTGRKSNGAPLDAPACDTLIYLMAVANIREVVATLLRAGRSRRTPCAFIERGTWKTERVVEGTLATIAGRAERSGLAAPAVFVVGDVVRQGRRVYGHKFQN